MARMRTLVTAVLLALLVAVTLSLPGEGGQAGAVEPRTVTAKIMIPAAAFTPQSLNRVMVPGWDYLNEGQYLEVQGYPGFFLAPIQFPVPEVRITGITMYADDHDLSWDHDSEVCASLYRSRPSGGYGYIVRQSRVCTADAVYSTTPQVVSNRLRISQGAVDTGIQSSYLQVTIRGDGRLYGVRITYTYETTP